MTRCFPFLQDVLHLHIRHPTAHRTARSTGRTRPRVSASRRPRRPRLFEELIQLDQQGVQHRGHLVRSSRGKACANDRYRPRVRCASEEGQRDPGRCTGGFSSGGSQLIWRQLHSLSLELAVFQYEFMGLLFGRLLIYYIYIYLSQDWM